MPAPATPGVNGVKALVVASLLYQASVIYKNSVQTQTKAAGSDQDKARK